MVVLKEISYSWEENCVVAVAEDEDFAQFCPPACGFFAISGLIRCTTFQIVLSSLNEISMKNADC